MLPAGTQLRLDIASASFVYPDSLAKISEQIKPEFVATGPSSSNSSSSSSSSSPSSSVSATSSPAPMITPSPPIVPDGVESVPSSMKSIPLSSTFLSPPHIGNLRQIATCGAPIYGVSQPSLQGFRALKEHVSSGNPKREIVWLNLREEPIIYICGAPFVLRDQYTDEASVKSYGGIKAERLELLESRLQEDAISELSKFSDRILVHGDRGALIEVVSKVTPLVPASGASSASSSNHASPHLGPCSNPGNVSAPLQSELDGSRIQGESRKRRGSSSSNNSTPTTSTVLSQAENRRPIDQSAMDCCLNDSSCKITACWLEEVAPAEVTTVRQVSEQLNISYYRVPITARNAPEEEDFDQILKIVASHPLDSPIVVNCQAGLGRSTTGTVIVWLVREWINPNRKHSIASRAQSISSSTGTSHNSNSAQSRIGSISAESPKLSTHSSTSQTQAVPLKSESESSAQNQNHAHYTDNVTYKCVHSLLRVIRDGLKVKEVVDEAIDICGVFMHIRASIESDRQSPQRSRRALLNLRRYFLLLVFQAYLADTPASEATHKSLESFRSWMKRHPEVQNMYSELLAADCNPDTTADALISVEKLAPGDGIALTSEISQVVQERSGAVLARLTILKSDAFVGCQKLSLPERIEGAANFRFISFKSVRQTLFKALHLPFSETAGDCGPPQNNSAEFENDDADVESGHGVCGVAMPTKAGIQHVIERLGFSAENAKPRAEKLVWTCLREEPVLYVNQRPFVLRTFRDPLRNLETTGIARERVEQMEKQMKADAAGELENYGGRLLLHDEEATKNGFEIVPLWETVIGGGISTPSEAFNAHSELLDYLRIPITDEQGPIPHVFDDFVERTSVLGRTFVFNCQMGRGRTTTGMVITCIIHGILLSRQPSLLSDMLLGGQTSPASISTMSAVLSGPQNNPMGIQRSLSSMNDGGEAAVSNSGTSLSKTYESLSSSNNSSLNENEDDEFEENEVIRFKRGEYQVILRLVAVLPYGKLAKIVADTCIDSCSHMQNLREEIHSFKLRTESLTPSSPKYKAVKQVGLNYLVRYFYLIAFSGYLLERVAHQRSASIDGKLSKSEDSNISLANQTNQEDAQAANLNRLSISTERKSTISTLSPYLSPVGASFNNSSNGGTAAPCSSTFYVKFSEWLRDRREITAILKSDARDFS